MAQAFDENRNEKTLMTKTHFSEFKVDGKL
jgi:hypothetical protein